jgi:hypothetical protein
MEGFLGFRITHLLFSLLCAGMIGAVVGTLQAEEQEGSFEYEEIPNETGSEEMGSEQEIETLIEYYRDLQEKNIETPAPLLKPWQLKLLKAFAEGAISTTGVSLYRPTDPSIPPTLKAYQEP